MCGEDKMTDFNVFGDFSKLSDEAIMEQVNKLNEQIAYYYMTEYSYLVPQLQEWRDMRMDAIDERVEKRRLEKAKLKKNSHIIFDNSDEVMDEAKEKDTKEKEEKEKLLNPKKK